MIMRLCYTKGGKAAIGHVQAQALSYRQVAVIYDTRPVRLRAAVGWSRLDDNPRRHAWGDKERK